ncbi:MAG: hypothetical protein J1F02_02840 [Lachnospiraceae bacterium]|nr:hypothetical protein [Lachnospiraceae bacterium]
MNRRKALFYHEWHTMRWILLAGCGCALVLGGIFYAYIAGIANNQEYSIYFASAQHNLGSVFSEGLVSALSRAHTVAVPVFAFMSILQFADSHSRKSREYLASLPCTQSERFAVKAAVGFGIITISCLVLSVLVLITRSRFMDIFVKWSVLLPGTQVVYANETLLHTLRSLALFWLTLLALYAIFMAVQSLVRQGPMAALIGIGATAAPWLIATAVQSVLSYIMMSDYSEIAWQEVVAAQEQYLYPMEHIKNVCGSFWGLGTGIAQGGAVGQDYIYSVAETVLVSYENMWLLFGSMAVLLIGCTILGWQANKKLDMARAGMLVPIRRVRILIGVSFGICCGLALGLFVTSALQNGNMLFFCAPGIVTAVVMSLLCIKLLKRTVK